MDDESAAPQLARVRLEIGALRAQFREAHGEELRALEKGDLDGVREAGRRERALIEQLIALIDRLSETTAT